MQSMLVVLSLALLAVVAVSAEGDDVVILTEANFDKTIKDNEFVLVEFFAPWCGHCKKLAPEYARAATTLKKDGIVLGSVDATVEKDLGSKFEIRGYPTLKFFKNGVPTEYKGGRTEDTIVSWLRKATGPAAKLVAGKAAIDSFAADAKVAVVGFFASAESEEYKNLVAVAKKDEDNAFAYTVNADDAAAFGVTVPSVILFKKFDEGKAVLASGLTEAGIAEFITVQGTPLVIPFSMDVVASIFQSKLGKVAFLFTETENKDFAELAKEYRGKLVFATADSSVDRLNSHVGLTKEDFPKLLILTTDGQMVKYPSDAGVSKEALKSHIDSFLAGNAKPFFKSEEVPKENNGPVTIVVGKNFKEVVLDSTKDVLLEIYAPWCGHCKQLEPKWNELGEFFESEDSIVVAKMDGTANEVDGISVRGFPTIRFFPAGENKKVGGEEYQGGRELADFKTFLQANAKTLKSKPAAKEDL